MKAFILITCLISSITSIAATIEIQVINTLDNTPFKSCELVVQNQKGDETLVKTDTKGLLTMKLVNKTSIELASSVTSFYISPINLDPKNKGLKKHYTLFAYPTKEYEEELYESQDCGKSSKEEEKDSTSVVYDYPEKYAEFVGGASTMRSFLAEEIIYPEIALEMGDQGKVFVEFVVEKDGSLTCVKILRGVSREIDRETKRVVRAMPAFTPSEVNDEKVRTRCRIPISYKLN